MNKLMIRFIKYYKSNLTEFTNKCKYTPTCSSYTLECYQRFNFFKASFLSLKRILRCNPCFRGKYDPVPSSFEERHYEAIIESLLYPRNNN